MGYDRGDSFPFDFESNGVPFGSKRKENCHHDHIPFNAKGNGIRVFSVQCTVRKVLFTLHNILVTGVPYKTVIFVFTCVMRS